jgi:hypothetical protein
MGERGGGVHGGRSRAWGMLKLRLSQAAGTESGTYPLSNAASIKSRSCSSPALRALSTSVASSIVTSPEKSLSIIMNWTTLNKTKPCGTTDVELQSLRLCWSVAE